MRDPNVVEDLMGPLQIESPDEARLVSLFRVLNQDDRSQHLFELTRSYFARHVAEAVNMPMRAADRNYLHEEIEQELRLICPWELLKDAMDAFVAPVMFRGLWRTAWGDIAPVILGSDECDGQRADELFEAVRESCWADRITFRDFQRSDALRLIQQWREAALQHVFAVALATPPECSQTGRAQLVGVQRTRVEIEVVDDEGLGVPGVSVSVSRSGAEHVDTIDTDENGRAGFDLALAPDESAMVQIYVDGESRGWHQIRQGDAAEVSVHA